MATTEPYQGGQSASTYNELTEHAIISNVHGKKVFLVGDDGNQIGSDLHGTENHLLVDTQDISTTGTLTQLDSTVEMDVHGVGSALILVSGTWTGKIVFEGAIDGTWSNLSLVQPLGGITQNGIQNDNQNGQYRVLIIAGYTKLRARMSSYTNGTATILINASDLVAANYVWQLNQANLKATVYPVDQDGATDPFSGYGLYAVDSDDATYFYVMYQNRTPAWIIIRITLATGITNYSKGTGTTSTAWTGRAGQTFADYDVTFS